MMLGPLTLAGIIDRVVNGTGDKAQDRRVKRLLLSNRSVQRTEFVWEAFCRYIQEQLDLGRGVAIAGFGKFGANTLQEGRLSLSLCEHFIRAYKLQVIRIPFDLKTLIEVNYSMLSMRLQLPKDEVKQLIGEVLHTIGQVILECKQPLMIDFGVLGMLYADHHRLQFAFGDRGQRSKRSSDGESSASQTFSRDAPTSALGLQLTGRNAGKYCPSIAECDEELLEEREKGENEPGDIGIPPLQLGRSSGSQMNTARSSASGSTRSGTGQQHSGYVSGRSTRRSLLSFRSGDDDATPIILPPFLNRDNRDPLLMNSNMEKIVKKRNMKVDLAMDKAFHRMEQEIKDQIEKLRKEDEEIARRNEMSEMAYKDRQINNRREILQNTSFIMDQAKEHRSREQQEKEAIRKAGTIIAEGNVKMPFPVDKGVDHVKVNRSKQKLKSALQHQIRAKARRAREERSRDVAEESYLIDCSIKMMQADRKARKQKALEERNTLTENWKRQQKLNQLAKIVTRGSNGKLRRHVSSDGSLLTVRSLSSDTSTDIGDSARVEP
mmetsp:Transcript_5051/g.9522  ORF Transcript_5051/g.9522 Transcript_5051/m.9522 type:complete len:549 (+) Transcript_5051:177-1823(+)